MTLTSVGDLARGFMLRQQSNTLKQQMDRLTNELSSGVTSDISAHLRGNLLQMSDVSHQLTRLDSFRLAADRGRIDTQVMQSTLAHIQSETQDFASSAISFGTASSGTFTGTFAHQAKTSLQAVFSALNTEAAGRALFAGDETTVPPLATFGTFLAGLETAISGAANMADYNAALDVFFGAGGDFETTIYQGGSQARAAYTLGDGESVNLDIRADDAVFRNALRQLAGAALVDNAAVTLTQAEQREIAFESGKALIEYQDQITDLRGDLGFAEARIDRAATRIASEMTGLELIQSQMIGIDPFQAATELEAVQLRLETLYTLTARSSQLNLVNFLS